MIIFINSKWILLTIFNKTKRANWYIFRAVLVNCVGIFVLITGSCLSGIAIFAYYAKMGCDPFTNGDIKNKNQVKQLMMIRCCNTMVWW